jgi:hypothetical protein
MKMLVADLIQGVVATVQVRIFVLSLAVENRKHKSVVLSIVEKR